MPKDEMKANIIKVLTDWDYNEEDASHEADAIISDIEDDLQEG